MRIAVLGRTFSRQAGGAETYAVEIAQELAVKHEVHVFTQSTDRPVQGVTYHRVWCISPRPRWLNHLLFAWLTWRSTRKGFDVVHSHELTWHGQIQTIHVRPVRFNLLVDVTGWRLVARWLKVLTSPRLLTYVCLEAARFKQAYVVATSEPLAVECKKAYPKAHIEVIEPGIRLPTMRMEKNDAKTHLGLDATRKLILFVANDFARKGLDALLGAMALLKKQAAAEPTFKMPLLLIVGGGQPSIQSYQKKAELLEVGSDVQFEGAQKDMPTYYFAADVLAHPTLEDSFGMVVLEALAHQLSVVVSGAPYCGISAQLMNLAKVYILSNPKNNEELAVGIAHFLSLESANILDFISDNSNVRYLSNATWSESAKKYKIIMRKGFL
jgi:UDP-glucose:(heptosyl)LPS alpha-1,3-glucosyltransferase